MAERPQSSIFFRKQNTSFQHTLCHFGERVNYKLQEVPECYVSFHTIAGVYASLPFIFSPMLQ